MKFLALQTNIEEIKKQFIAEGEDVLLATAHHFFIFFFAFLAQTLLIIIYLTAIIFFLVMFQSVAVLITVGILFILGFFYSLFTLFNAYVQWRYNFLIVSTRKVVIVEQRSFIYQTIVPIHLENIASTSFESQFFGIWHCGLVRLHLHEREEGSTKLIDCRYIPKPDTVAGIIENAIALLSQKKEEGQKLGEQRQQIAAVKEKAEKEIPSMDGKSG